VPNPPRLRSRPSSRQTASQRPHEHVVVRHLELRWCDHPGEPNVFTRHLRVLAADAPRLHGLTPSLAIVDELHTHPDDEVYLALRTATLKRSDSKLIVISTAGQGADSPLGRLRGRALGQPQVTRRGAFTDARGPSLRLFEWSVPEDANITDPKVVKKANPASWITLHALREQHEAVAEVAYRRYHGNQWTAKVGAWLPAGAWQACAGETSFQDGERVWVGVDVGGERSDSAVVWVNENLHVGVQTWTGDDAVLEVAAFVAELAENYQIVEAVYDPWRAGQMAQEWEQRGIPAVAFPQSDSRMIPACERLYDAVVHKRLVHPDDGELSSHVHAAVAKHSRRGWRLEKADRSSKIDAVVALAMALDRHAYKPEPVELVGWL
jgi:phage terminase large subunit-like protein